MLLVIAATVLTGQVRLPKPRAIFILGVHPTPHFPNKMEVNPLYSVSMSCFKFLTTVGRDKSREEKPTGIFTKIKQHPKKEVSHSSCPLLQKDWYTCLNTIYASPKKASLKLFSSGPGQYPAIFQNRLKSGSGRNFGWIS